MQTFIYHHELDQLNNVQHSTTSLFGRWVYVPMLPWRHINKVFRGGQNPAGGYLIILLFVKCVLGYVVPECTKTDEN